MIMSAVLLLSTVSCNYFAGETLESFSVLEKEVQKSSLEKEKEVQSLMKQLTDSAMSRPDIYASAFNHMNEFHTKSERLLNEMQHVRELIEEQVGETGNYEEWDQNIDALFFEADHYSENGDRFVKAIKDYNLTAADQLFFFPEAENLAQKAFNIDDVKNRDGEDVDWFSYNFKGFPPIATKTKIAVMEKDVKEVEATFLKALIEKPQF